MTTTTMSRGKTYDMVYIAVFAVVMAICSWISIPATVPFTLQTFGVFLAVGVLGGKRGTLSILVYILLGAVGVPVFAGFSGGITEKKKGFGWKVVAILVACVIKIAGYYIAEGIIYGNWITPASSIPGNLLQVGVAAVVVLIISGQLQKLAERMGLCTK